MRILAIESTCDETAAAIVESCGSGVKVLSNVVASSAEIHQKYGGVVPEVAAREQVASIIPVIREAIEGYRDSIDAIAVSYGPGLMGSLLIGVETAKVLAWAWDKPLLKVNHMTGHMMANWIVQNDEDKTPQLPSIGLVVSGGHTDIIFLNTLNDWQWVGGTRDDAVGEAFDKVARILNLPYPGGPEIDKAERSVSAQEILELPRNMRLPRPLISEDNLEMSFSGIKAAVSRMVEGLPTKDERNTLLIASEFTIAVCDVLAEKVKKAIDKYNPTSVILAGGVAANSSLRERIRSLVQSYGKDFFVPEMKYCGDNAAMIGAAATLRPTESESNLIPDPGLMTV